MEYAAGFFACERSISVAKPFVPLFSSEVIANAAELYATADEYAEVRLGETLLFWNGLTKVRYASLSSIAWAYIRQEDSRMTICCGKGVYNSFYLMLVGVNGKRAKIPVETEGNIRGVIQTLEERCPAITIGYNEQNTARFMAAGAMRQGFGSEV